MPQSSPDEGHRSLENEARTRFAKLPPFHPVALKLLTISTESESAEADFVAAFRSDPALAAELLQVANSFEFGFAARIDSVPHAILALGLERVRSLAFTLAMRCYTRNMPRRQALQPVWSHSIATAIVAERVGAFSGAPLAYTAGLIHDVGRLGLMITHGGYSEFLGRPFHDGDESLSEESRLFGVTHTEAGAALAAAWGFPTGLCECIRLHHDSLSAGAPAVTALVALACRYAAAIGFPETLQEARPSNDSLAAMLPPHLQERSDLSPESLSADIRRQIANVWK